LQFVAASANFCLTFTLRLVIVNQPGYKNLVAA
jgi:hypothetical protein